MNEETALNPYYILSTEIDGTEFYYAEDASGKAFLTEKKNEAWLGDGTEKFILYCSSIKTSQSFRSNLCNTVMK